MGDLIKWSIQQACKNMIYTFIYYLSSGMFTNKNKENVYLHL